MSARPVGFSAKASGPSVSCEPIATLSCGGSGAVTAVALSPCAGWLAAAIEGGGSSAELYLWRAAAALDGGGLRCQHLQLCGTYIALHCMFTT